AAVSPEREQAGSAGPARRRPATAGKRRLRGSHRLVNAMLALVVIVAGIVAVLVRSGAPSTASPATGAAALVPADALAYVHVSTDPARSTVNRAVKLASRFPDYPLIGATVLSRLPAIASGGASAN